MKAIIDRVDFSNHRGLQGADAFTRIGIGATGAGLILIIAGELLRRASRTCFYAKDEVAMEGINILYSDFISEVNK